MELGAFCSCVFVLLLSLVSYARSYEVIEDLSCRNTRCNCFGQPENRTCATDNNIYKNNCALKCKSDCTQGAVTAIACNCPSAYNPVCGSDGRTYNNDCQLQCTATCDICLQKMYDGPCKGCCARLAELLGEHITPSPSSWWYGN